MKNHIPFASLLLALLLACSLLTGCGAAGAQEAPAPAEENKADAPATGSTPEAEPTESETPAPEPTEATPSEEERYEAARELFRAGDGEAAAEAFAALGDYADSARYLALCPYASAQIGDTILFGRYEQDGDETDGAEEIPWLILDRQGDRLLLMTKDILFSAAYNPTREPTTWEQCTLRTLLNESFLETAFDEREAALLCVTKVVTPDNEQYHSLGGADTEDRVFVLSVEELEKALPEAADRIAYPTRAAASGHLYIGTNGACWWWLRTPGWNGLNVATVQTDGKIGYRGHVRHTSMAVRPALWIGVDD